MKLINIFGSTGSIGTQALEVIEKFSDFFQINILCGGNNYRLLAAQVMKFNPKIVLISGSYLSKLKILLPNHKNIFSIDDFENILKEGDGFDISVMAISGFQALNYSYILAKYSYRKIIAMANKEAIICGGEIFLNYLKLQKISLIPIDSEHNSAFQLFEFIKNRENGISNNIYKIDNLHCNDSLNFTKMLNFNSDKNDLNVKKLIITASGGPFLNYNNKQLENVTISDAIKHPRWNMGHKISVDSATLMNKALELIEAHHLFGMKVDAIIHPQSVVHAILEIENVDKAESKSFAFLSQPDMRLHIAHSISHENYLSWGEDELNIENLQFDFQDIDRNRFPFIEMAHDIINNDAHLATIFNLAGEIVVDLFLRGRIRFVEIVSYVHKIFNNYSDIKKFNSIEEIMSTDYEIRTRCIEDFAGVI